MKLKDWNRPIHSDNVFDIREGKFYDYESYYKHFASEGQRFRYELLIPRITKVIAYHGFERFNKLIGYNLLVETFRFSESELMGLFNRNSTVKYTLSLNNGRNYYRDDIYDCYFFHNTPICLFRHNILYLDKNINVLFLTYFRMPSNYLFKFIHGWAINNLGLHVEKLETIEIKPHVNIITYRDFNLYDRPSHTRRGTNELVWG